MWKYTVEVTGMKCPKCEAKANAAIEKAFSVKKVTSSHVDNKTVIISKDDLDEAKIKETITAVGYEAGEVKKEPKKFLGIF